MKYTIFGAAKRRKTLKRKDAEKNKSAVVDRPVYPTFSTRELQELVATMVD